jgi:hypothetical protein
MVQWFERISQVYTFNLKDGRREKKWSTLQGFGIMPHYRKSRMVLTCVSSCLLPVESSSEGRFLGTPIVYTTRTFEESRNSAKCMYKLVVLVTCRRKFLRKDGPSGELIVRRGMVGSHRRTHIGFILGTNA